LPPDVIIILRLKCTKFDFGWGSVPNPAGGAHSAPPDPLARSKGSYFKGKGGRGREKRKWRGSGKGRERKEMEGRKFLSWLWGMDAPAQSFLLFKKLT